MAIDAKVDFLRQTEQALADKVTVSDMAQIMNVISDVLQGYDMRSIEVWEDRNDDLLSCYLAAMRVECRSEKTIARYEYVIRRMMEFVTVPTRRITVHHLRNYLAHEKERGVADSTLEGTRQIFSAYFNWLQRESLIEKNPTANLGTVKVAKKEKLRYTEIEMEKLNQNCETIRDRAILHFLASTGCRISEMTELNRDDVDLEKLECVVHGKGNKERTVFLSEVAGMIIREYLDGRKDDSEALFIGRIGERLQPGGVRFMLNELAKRAGVEHVHPHKFRRTLATELTRRGMPIQEVAKILGHEKIDTTMRYLDMNNETVKANYRRYA